MAYLFGAVNADNIDCGTSVPGATTFSCFVRLKMTTANAFTHVPLARRVNPSGPLNFQIYFTDATLPNQANFFFSGNGSAATWLSGFTAGSIHTLVCTVDDAFLRIYADTDATAKATAVQTAFPDTSGTQHFVIGNTFPSGGNESADATIYEVGWWPGVVLTGAEAAGIGAGTPPATPPAHYWPLLTDANALFGGQHGTVTGATLVAHSGTNLYAAPTRRHGLLLGVG